MRATRLVSLVVPLLVVPGLAAAQSRSFTYERGIDRPGRSSRRDGQKKSASPTRRKGTIITGE